ncbi:MAG: hypothetical protein DCC65_15100 [Planctomycetota bacterium]|nr:MAG: hypothetical protein DCC65_15100 [Planctomycetota bacterium]
MELIRFELLMPNFALVLARVAGMALAAPVFASTQIPRVYMAGLVVVISLMLFPAVLPLLPGELTVGQALAGMAGELVIGEIIGLAAGAVFFAAQIAGQVVSHQSGLSLGQVVNPLFDEETSILDQIWFFSVMILFFALRGHLAVVEAVLGSFRQVPPLMLVSDASIGEFAASIARTMFDAALRLAGPAVLALLLTSLVLGFLTKTMPQLNIFSVGFSLKIAVAVLFVAVTMAHSEGIIATGLANCLDDVGELMQTMSRKVVHAG